MSSTVLLNLDSKDCTFSNVAEFSTQISGVNPHITTHALVRPLANVQRISLKSAELPITADNVRACNYTDTLGLFQFDNGTLTYQNKIF